MQVQGQEIALPRQAVDVGRRTDGLRLEFRQDGRLDRAHVHRLNAHAEGTRAPGQLLAARTETDDAQHFPLQLRPRGLVHHARLEVRLGLVKPAREHEDVHHGALGQPDAAELPRAVGNRKVPGLHVGDVDVVQTGADDLPEPGVPGRVVHLAGADRPARIQHRLHACELLGQRFAAVVNREIMSGRYCLDNLLLPQGVYIRQRQIEHFESLHGMSSRRYSFAHRNSHILCNTQACR